MMEDLECQYHRIVEKIRIVRNSRDFSQDCVACKLGISQRAYSKLENGQIRMTGEYLLSITKIFEISIPELLYNEDSIEKKILLFTKKVMYLRL